MTRSLTETELLAALPDLTSTLQLPGLREPVDIIRDSWGIPHIRAANEHDAFFAQGFVTAQDRLWQMDYDRRRALGRWAEWAGPSALAEDRLMRRFRLEHAARADLEVTSPEARAMVEAYTDGVNAFIATTASLPIEYALLDATPEPWLPWHCLAVYKVRNMMMGTYEMKLWRARLALVLGPDKASALMPGAADRTMVTLPPGEIAQGPPLESLDELAAAAAQCNELEEIGGGSNAWAISGDMTTSGLPLVAGDSHRALDTPNVYYQIYLSCPQFRVSGFAVPGVPGAPHFSHTAYVGWGMTHGYGDYQDLYLERFRTRDGQLEYADQGRWRAADVSDETLRVRGAASETLRVVSTPHGSIIAGNPANGHGLACCHTGAKCGTPWLDSVYRLLLAQSADELEAAMREWTEPVNNVVYADIHGQYGHRYRGRIPLRPMANAWRPVPGWTGEYEWRGRIPFDELPHLRNPSTGFVATCNNRVTTDDYPYYINTYFQSDFRIRRVTARLQALSPGMATIDDMAAIHADLLSIPAQIFVGALPQVESDDARVSAACDLLLQWDCRMTRASAAAAIYAVARTYLYADIMTHVFEDLADEALGAPGGTGRGPATHASLIYTRAIAAMKSGDASLLPAGKTWPSLIEAALRRAIDELEDRLGKEMTEWAWGRIHYTRPRHPLSRVFPELAPHLDPPGVAVDGDADTPQQGGYSHTDRFVVTLLSVNRYIHDPADWRRSRWITPLGASGHPGSPHYADQVNLWADTQTIPQLWDWADIQAAAETQQRLEPYIGS